MPSFDALPPEAVARSVGVTFEGGSRVVLCATRRSVATPRATLTLLSSTTLGVAVNSEDGVAVSRCGPVLTLHVVEPRYRDGDLRTATATMLRASIGPPSPPPAAAAAAARPSRPWSWPWPWPWPWSWWARLGRASIARLAPPPPIVREVLVSTAPRTWLQCVETLVAAWRCRRGGAVPTSWHAWDCMTCAAHSDATHAQCAASHPWANDGGLDGAVCAAPLVDAPVDVVTRTLRRLHEGARFTLTPLTADAMSCSSFARGHIQVYYDPATRRTLRVEYFSG